MANFLKVELRIPLARHQADVVKSEFPKMHEVDKREYICLILGTDNVLIDKVEPLLDHEIVPTFCGDINVHATHDSFDARFGTSAVLRCPGMS